MHTALERSNDRLIELRGHQTLFDLDRQILQNNLYGVDLNEEAIEICRLSLWIKTAARGKVLTALDHTIQVGNSVVDDPQVHPKAFDWRAAFPEAFAGGGFDVIVANPPYIASSVARRPHCRYSVKRSMSSTEPSAGGESCHERKESRAGPTVPGTEPALSGKLGRMRRRDYLPCRTTCGKKAVPRKRSMPESETIRCALVSAARVVEPPKPLACYDFGRTTQCLLDFDPSFLCPLFLRGFIDFINHRQPFLAYGRVPVSRLAGGIKGHEFKRVLRDLEFNSLAFIQPLQRHVTVGRRMH
jgi:hypothetical protein